MFAISAELMNAISVILGLLVAVFPHERSYATTNCDLVMQTTMPVYFHVNIEDLLSLQQQFLEFKSKESSFSLSFRDRYQHSGVGVRSLKVSVYTQTRAARTFSLLGLFEQRYSPDHYYKLIYKPAQPEIVKATFASLAEAVSQYQLGIHLSLSSEQTQSPSITMSGFMPHILLLIESVKFASPDHIIRSVRD